MSVIYYIDYYPMASRKVMFIVSAPFQGESGKAYKVDGNIRYVKKTIQSINLYYNEIENEIIEVI